MPPNSSLTTPPGSPDDLLRHYEEYGVLICRPCEFAIQPSALASHLLKHQIYRSERRKLLGRLSHLKLKDPSDVCDPPPLSAPVPELHVYKGARCLASGCEYICASEKRMSQHWSDLHGERESRNVQSRLAWLQTFFRGNKIRYFEVSKPLALTPKSVEGSPDSGMNTANALDGLSSLDIPQPLDMDTLRYLLHYINSTSLTLPRTETESAFFWSSTIPNEALSHKFLMYALLGLSAFHLSTLTTDSLEVQRHTEASLLYQSASIADFRTLAVAPDQSNAQALIAYSRFIGVQQSCRNYTTTAQLVDFLHLVRGSIETLISLQQFLPEGSDFKLPIEELEGLDKLDDEKSIAKDAQNMANIPPAMLHRLDTLPQRLTECLPLPSSDEILDVQACASASVTLIAAYARAYSSPNFSASDSNLYVGSMQSETISAIWAGIESWTRYLSDRFIAMLERAHPAALVIFAHFSMLVKRFEDRYWYIKGMPSRMLRLIEDNLEDRLKPLVADLYDLLEDQDG